MPIPTEDLYRKRYKSGKVIRAQIYLILGIQPLLSEFTEFMFFRAPRQYSLQ